jgi:hypothetical protein
MEAVYFNNTSILVAGLKKYRNTSFVRDVNRGPSEYDARAKYCAPVFVSHHINFE